MADLMLFTKEKVTTLKERLESYEKSHSFASTIEKHYKAKLRLKDDEIGILNQLLGKKKEDFSFGIEQLKEIKSWAKNTVEEITERAKEEIEKKDLKIKACEAEIKKKQQTIQQVITNPWSKQTTFSLFVSDSR